jgi:cobalt-zinc-cadmium efflux system outer membrane protein
VPVNPAPSDETSERQAPGSLVSRVVQPMAESQDRRETEAVPRPEPEASSGLTLDLAIHQCLLNDPKIRAGLEGISQAQADALTASLRPNPEVAVAGVLLPLSRKFTVDEPAGPSEFDVGFSYPVDWFLFGKRAAAMCSACVGVSVSEAEYADLVRQRATETALAFYDVLEAQALLEVDIQTLGNLEQVEAVTRNAVANGGRPQVELDRIRLDLLTARRGRRDANLDLVRAKASLRALLGADAADPEFEVAGQLDGPLTAEPLGVEEAYATAAENRPDILALRRRVARARADAEVERRNALPEVVTDWGIGHQFQRSIGAPDATMWGTGLTMSVPLFNRNQGNRSRAASVVSQSGYELQAGLVELRAEIEQSVQALVTARENAASVAQEDLQLAARVRNSINQAYEAGGRPLLDALDAQRNYRETFRIFVSTRAEYWRSLYRYQSALGKEFTP